jgi:hypothetical protein
MRRSARRRGSSALLAGTPPEFEPDLPRLRSRVTVGSVIRHLDGLFNRHILSNWRPRALETIMARIQQCEAQIADLGTPPEELEVDVVVKRALHVFRKRAIFDVEEAVVRAVSKLLEGLEPPAAELPTREALKSRWDEQERERAAHMASQERLRRKASKPNRTAFTPEPFSPPGGPVSRLQWVREAITCRDELESKTEGWLENGWLERIGESLNDGLATAFKDNHGPLRLRRFTRVLAALRNELAESWSKHSVPLLKLQIDRRVSEACRPKIANPLQGLEDDLIVTILTEVLQVVKDLLPCTLEEDPALLAEEESQAQLRADLNARLESLKEHARQIRDIEEAIGAAEGEGESDSEECDDESSRGSDHRRVRWASPTRAPS